MFIMETMNERQKKVLAAVVEEYTKTAVPVGSEILVKKYNFKVSPATIRNDLGLLEEKGYLYQPHISSGRIPADKGYRYFVDTFLGDAQLPLFEQRKLQKELLKLKTQHKRLTKTTAKLLSIVSGNLALSGIPNKGEFSEFGMHDLLAEPEFKKLDDVCRLVEVLDSIDEKVGKLAQGIKGNETKIFIGKENPIKQISDCSMVASTFKNEQGEKGIIAIIGPKRMEYKKNKSLVDFVKKLLSSSVVVIIAVGSESILVNFLIKT